jgi:hypothetical protein
MRSSERTRYLLSLSLACGRKHFNPETGRCLIARDTAWYAIALLLSDAPDDLALGLRILETLPAEDATHTPATFLALLRHPGMQLSPAARTHLFEEVHRSLIDAALVEWHDGNVNHPLGAYATLVLGGELCGERWAVELGARRLRRFRAVIGDRKDNARRQAEMSEYNSPTYTALNLWFLALVAEYAADRDARSIARFLEQRLWVDVALHYHAPSGQFAGPHSRSYTDDSHGGFSALHCTMFAATDIPVALHPALADRFDHPSSLIQNSLIAITPFHCPDAAARLAMEKPFPFSWERMTYGESYHENNASAGFDHEMFAGGWSELRTYMTAEYALGTASRPYVNGGHADSFLLRLQSSGSGLTSFRSMFARGVFNDAQIGRGNRTHVTGGATDASYLYEESRTAIFQHRHTAVVLAMPKRQGAGVFDAFRVDIIIAGGQEFDAFLADGAPVGMLPASYPCGTRLALRDGATWIGILPLTPEPAAGSTPIEIRRHDEFLIVSIWNHRGAPREATRDELERWRNGFVIELGTMQTYPSEVDFVSHLSGIRVMEDVTRCGARRVELSAGERSMALVYDPAADRILSQQVNGEEQRVRHFAIDATGEEAMPEWPVSLFGREAWSGYDETA